jgi:transposase
MRDTDLFQLALGLTPPWHVVSCEFDMAKHRLDIEIDFPRGSLFACPVCGREGCPAYDTERHSWRHLNFFQYEAYLTARVPRVSCGDCGIKTVEVPWTRSGSGFTLLFEALIMMLAKAMPVKSIANLVKEHDTRIWRVLNHYVHESRQGADFSAVTEVGVDETSSKRGHNYVSVFVDMQTPKVLFATEGKDVSTLERFKTDLEAHHGDPSRIQEVCCDMSPAFISGVEKHFPEAQLTFDKFHVLKIINEGVDEVRRQEQQIRPELKRTRYLWLKNPGNLKENQAATLAALQVKNLNLKTVRAYHIRLNFQEFWNQPLQEAEAFLKKWYYWATHSRLEPIKKAAYTIKRHWDGILRWFTSKINNGILEGINSLIQAAKAKARGYRTTKNLITMIYLIGGKLEFRLPT